MALVLTEPFNNFTAAPWTASSFTIIAGGRTGNGAQSGGASICAYTIPSAQEADTLTIGFAVRVSTLASARPVLFLRSDATVTIHTCVQVETDGSITVRRGNTTAAIIGQTATGLVVANTWYYLELQIKLHDTLGTVVLRLDGTQRLNLTAQDTKNAGTKTVFDSVTLQGASGGTHTFDDLYLRNDNVFQGDPMFVSASGTGAITFGGSGTAVATGVSATGSGAIAFGGAGTAKIVVVATGSGAIAFAGTATAIVTFLGGSGAITFDGRGTAKISPLIVAGVGHIDFAGRGDIDVQPSLAVYAPPEWSWLVLNPDGTPIGPLTTASARKLTFPLDGAATAAFTMPGDHPETATIAELGTDVYVARNGRPLFRGRIGGSSETHAAAADTVNLAATDYRGLLDHRLIWPTSQLEFVGADQADIAWQLIADSQALGDLRIHRGAGSVTGVLRDRTFTEGTAIGQAINGVAGVADGFDWEVDASLAFNLYSPERGRYPADVPGSAPILTYGRDVVAVTTTVDPSKYGNAVFFTGSKEDTEPATPVASAPPGVGRWELQRADVNATLQTTVDEEAAGELAASSQLISAITVTLAADIWNPYELWLGDRVRVLVAAGRLDLDVIRRIVQIDVTLDDTGVETVALTIGSAPPKLSDRLSSLAERITDLENHTGRGGGGGGGGGDGGIKEITSIGGTILVTAPTGPTTNLEVASAVGHIAVTNPTGPTVNLEYVAPNSDTVTATYHVGVLTDLPPTGFHSYGFYSFPVSPPSWLLPVPASEAGWTPDLGPPGGTIVRIVAPGTYTLSAWVATSAPAMGTDIDGNTVMVPITLSFAGIGPFGVPIIPGGGGVEYFTVGIDPLKVLTARTVTISSFDLAAHPTAGWSFITSIGSYNPAALLRGGDITLTAVLTRIA